MITKQFSIIFSSDPRSGASQISTNPINAGSVFSVVLNNPISIPKEAKSAELLVTKFTGWWTILNITQDFNDTFQFSFTSSSPHYNNGNKYIIKVPQGIYSLPSLANAINLQMASLFPSLPANPITFNADQSTQRVIVVFNIAYMQIEFNIASTMRYLLGFYGDSSSIQVAVSQDIVPNPATFPNGSTVNLVVYANQVANFNTIDSLLVNCAELSGGIGIPTNGRNYNTIANPIINAPVGSQIIYSPVFPDVINIDHLIGRNLTNLTFSLTDQNANPVNTNSEIFSVNCLFRYYLPITD
jgi:hypothetical protein